MSDYEVTRIGDEVSVWLDPGGGITIKAVTAEGDPVELSTSEAREVASALRDLAARDDVG